MAIKLFGARTSRFPHEGKIALIMLCILRFGRGQLALQVLMRASFILPVILSAFSLFAEQEVTVPTPVVPQEQSSLALPAEAIPPEQKTPEIALIEPLVAAIANPQNSSEGYTINYNTVSILEYVRFASKICNVNFIFNSADLDFTVTVVSDAPITSENVMSTLVQVLRIHGLELLEQDNNLVIHKATDVRQIATLVTESGQGGKAAIVTRIFKIKNTKVDSIAAIIRPMISTTALLETATDTRQLILTDVRTNVDKVASLIEILDSPSMPLEIKSYEGAHGNSLQHLIEITNQMMAPMSQGNPFILVPNDLANAIYIVSTPELVARAIAILQVVDVPAKPSVLQDRRLKSENVYIYKPLHRNGNDLLSALREITSNMEKAGLSEGDLIPTIESARWISESNSIMFIGTKESIGKVKELLASLDAPSLSEGEETSFFVYRPQNRTAPEVQSSILEMTRNLKDSKITDKDLLQTLSSARLNENANSLTFSGEAKTFAGVKELLSMIDVKGPMKLAKNSFFLYRPINTSAQILEGSLKNFAQTLDKSKANDEAIIYAIQNMQIVSETNSILFTGSETTLKKLQEILPSFDAIPSGAQNQFFIYKPKVARGDQLANSLKELTENLQANQFSDPALLRTLQSFKYVKATNSFLFTGDSASIKKLEEILASVDAPGSFKEKTFILYEPKYASKEKIEAYLKQLADNLGKKGGNEELLTAIRSMKWVDASYSFMFYGSDPALNQLQNLLQSFDNPAAAQTNFYMYRPQYVSVQKLQISLRDVADNLKKADLADPSLITAIETAKYVESTGSIVFTGSSEVIVKLQNLLKEIDVPSSQSSMTKPGYYIYKLQNTTGDVIEEDLDALAKDFTLSGLKDVKVLDVIRNIRYVKETNSLLLTGDPKAIEETKEIVAQYDSPKAAVSSSNFFMYKPLHLSATQLQKSLRDVAENLKKAELADPGLLHTIQTSKYVETTNSIIFTGSQETITKIQTLLKDIDVPAPAHAPIQHVGQTTFLLYKLKYASGPQIVASLQNMASDLKQSNTSDKEFLTTLNSMKYIKETNSLLFTGQEEALKRVETLVEQFDVTNLSTPVVRVSSGPTEYYLYKPVALPGPELEQYIKDFEQNLKMSGHQDSDLYNTIDTMRWIGKTQNLMFTGTPKALEKIKELLKSFDVSGNLAASSGEPSIQAIDNTSFLVYKLQFHKGDEIQGALRQIAKDLINSNAPVNQNLLNSINSIQWLEVTNSLLCSGDQETLTRLRELIKNLDIPLKQVFIEVLVIETTMTNALSFGLEWGANYNFRNKYSATMANTIPSTPTSTAPSTFDTNWFNLKPPSTPTPQLFGTPAGSFDLGVIGEVIKHNGNSYLTLGSLLNALQNDGETTIVMTPKILAQDGRTSTLFQGQNVPFTGSFVSNTGQNSTVQTTNIEYRNIGMNLTVTPVLGNSDIVTLDISFDQSQQITNQNTGTVVVSGQNVSSGLTTSQTTMQTTVHVPDNHFLILSGNVNNSNTKTTTGIPCLGGLPLIGAAFSSSTDTINNSNIVVFLRPHILSSMDEMKQISKNQEEFFHDQCGTPFLQHNFDEAMDYVKTVEDE